MEILNGLWSFLSGKKRVIGGAAYLAIDALLAVGAIEPSTAIMVKCVAASVFGTGVVHAVAKAKV